MPFPVRLKGLADTTRGKFQFRLKQNSTTSKRAKSGIEKMTANTLAKAFRGELVPQDPNDESAQVLLEQIKNKGENVTTKFRDRRKNAAMEM